MLFVNELKFPPVLFWLLLLDGRGRKLFRLYLLFALLMENDDCCFCSRDGSVRVEFCAEDEVDDDDCCDDEEELLSFD